MTRRLDGRPAQQLHRYGDLVSALVANVVLIVVILQMNIRPAGLPLLGMAYAGLTMVGYYGLPLLVAVSLVWLITWPVKQATRPLGLAVCTLLIAYLLADAVAFRIIKFHIDAFWLEYLFKDFGGLGLPWTTVAMAVVGFGALVALEFAIFRFVPRWAHPRLFSLGVWIVLLLSFAASQITHIVAYHENDARFTSITPLLPFYIPFTSYRSADMYGDLLPMEMHDAAKDDFGGGTLRYPLRDPVLAGTPADSLPDIVVIMLESWRFDMMNADVTPHMNALAERSSSFTNHASTGNQTTCGVFGFFYGLHATYWPAVKANSTSIDNPVLIDVLEDRGYAMRVFARSGFDRHKITDTHFRGIDLVQEFPSRTVHGWDRDATDQIKDFMRENVAADHRYFAYIFFKATHFNYHYPDSLRIHTPSADLNVVTANQNTEIEPLLNDYRNAVHFNDLLVQEILDEIASLGRERDTVVIVTSDHGDELNDNGANYWGHGTNFTRWQVQVPLIVHIPGRAPELVTERTSHIDVVPTLLEEVFGCTSDPTDYSNGINLFGDRSQARPLIIGSYVNHAYLFGDDVFAIYPMHTRKYKFHDIEIESERPSPALMQQAVEQMKQFSNTDVAKY